MLASRGTGMKAKSRHIPPQKSITPKAKSAQQTPTNPPKIVHSTSSSTETLDAQTLAASNDTTDVIGENSLAYAVILPSSMIGTNSPSDDHIGADDESSQNLQEETGAERDGVVTDWTPTSSETVEAKPNSRRFFSRDTSSAGNTRDSNNNGRAIKRMSSFFRRSASLPVEDTASSSGAPDEAHQVNRKYEERMARARSKRSMTLSSSSENATVDNILKPLDNTCEGGSAHPQDIGTLSPVAETGGAANEEPTQEGLYIRRDGRWYDLSGNEYRPKRVIRFRWK